MTTALFILLTVLAVLFTLCCLAIIYLIYTARNKSQTALHNLDYLIVYASQSGQAEQYAKHTAADLIHAHYSVGLVSIEDLSTEILLANSNILWIVSTYGEGDAPDTAQVFVERFLDARLQLNQHKYAVLALGDRRYVNFCSFGQRLDAWLKASGAHALFDMVQVDQMQQRDLDQFATALSNMTGIQAKQFSQQQTWHTLELKQRDLLNAGSQGTGLYHLQFGLDSSITWQSGDIALIQCMNTPNQIAEFLAIHQLDPLLAEQLTFKNLRLTDASAIKALDIATWPELPQREYSIASIHNEAHLGLVVRHQVDGLGSTLLTQTLPLHSKLQVAIRRNPSFHLDTSDTPCIFIGNGSGIAGLLAHLKQRDCLGQSQNWLIYGERQCTFDAVFDEQLTTWKTQQHLQHLDRVYSRDNQQDRYVQDVIRRQADQFKAWLDQGAQIYLCGSLQGMAQGVDQVLLEILGQDALQQLKQEKRYLRDVY